ncbi:hypothetical protein B0H13DRAFT_1900197 [Mycena leptocephala]|nr:hypothetical protein B0H13DRAFT_1900197 [Mycena leptocephala]
MAGSRGGNRGQARSTGRPRASPSKAPPVPTDNDDMDVDGILADNPADDSYTAWPVQQPTRTYLTRASGKDKQRDIPVHPFADPLMEAKRCQAEDEDFLYNLNHSSPGSGLNVDDENTVEMEPPNAWPSSPIQQAEERRVQLGRGKSESVRIAEKEKQTQKKGVASATVTTAKAPTRRQRQPTTPTESAVRPPAKKPKSAAAPRAPKAPKAPAPTAVNLQQADEAVTAAKPAQKRVSFSEETHLHHTKPISHASNRLRTRSRHQTPLATTTRTRSTMSAPHRREDFQGEATGNITYREPARSTTDEADGSEGKDLFSRAGSSLAASSSLTAPGSVRRGRRGGLCAPPFQRAAYAPSDHIRVYAPSTYRAYELLPLGLHASYRYTAYALNNVRPTCLFTFHDI